MPLDTNTADPAALGLTCFGITTLLLSLVLSGLLPAEGIVVVIPLAFIFGGIVQMYAGLLEYREGNTFAMVAFNAYGGFWVWFALYEFLGVIGVFNTSAEPVVATFGVALIIWGVFTTYMWVGTFRLNWGLWLLFLAVVITFYLLGFGELLGNPMLATIGAYFGIFAGIIALYVSFAEVANWCFERTVLPLGSAPISGDGESAAEAAD